MLRNGAHGYCNSISWQVFFSQIRQTERLLQEADEKRLYTNKHQIEQLGIKARSFFLDAIGGVPDDGSPLNPQTLGVIEREKYTLNKVMYQSLENYYVTANLYIPGELDGPAPAILLCLGHSRDGKGYGAYKAMADLLAKNGFVVLAFDPPGQGERLNLIDRNTGIQKVQWGTREHSWLGLLCSLSGNSISRYFIRDAQRGIDYLSSLPEVDASKIGATGISGGGTQTSYLALVEDRISAAAPGCYVTNRLTYMKKFHAHDAEQNIFGHIPAGFDYCDFFVNFAPKPLLFLGAAYDFFPIEGLYQTYNIVKSAYEIYEKENNCQIYVDNNVHGFSPALRREALTFFANVLAGKNKSELDFDEAPLETNELQCTKSGYVLTDYPTIKGLDEKIIGELPEKSSLSGEQLRTHIKSLILRDRKNDSLFPKIVSDELTVQGYNIERIFFDSEQDITITAEMIKPHNNTSRLQTVLALLPEGTNTTANHDKMSELFFRLGADKNIFIVDVRGVGGARIADSWLDELSYRNMYGTLFKIAYNYWMLGDNFVTIRAFDALCALRYLRSREDVDVDNIEIYAEDDLAFVGLLTSVADNNIRNTKLRNLPSSYRQEASKVYYDRKLLNEWTTIHGMLKDFDIPDLLKLINQYELI